ncbi:MAG: 2,3-bisphosphoglycerate-dependent phosphoglycerate mutase [Gaiellaceae bacterium]|jgi:broad specificity phosphatase PhoE|nr:2,3-bisphosphoglycerate-dependent phosphoglycerate mutase [Gaiellaceae bacterium]
MPTLVRHAAVVVDATVPSPEWRLSDEGRAAATALELPQGPALSSPEPKALETAELAGLDAIVEPRLREVSRPWSDDYVADVERWFGGEELTGWEQREHALARLQAALDGFDGVAVSHGLAISLYAGLSFEEWRRLPFPAIVEC